MIEKFITIRSINICLFIIFLSINYCQPLIVDDLVRGAISALYNHTIINNLISDYNAYTGRMSAQLLAYIAFNEPYQLIANSIFNIINSLLLVSFISLIFNIVVQDKKLQKNIQLYLSFIFIFLCILFLSTLFKSIMWKTGGLQYFWGLWLITWLYYRQIHLEEKFKISNNLVIIFMGLFIGLYHEVYFITIFMLISVYYITNMLITKSTFNKNLYMFFIGNLIGGMILILAPGNYKRLKIINLEYHVDIQHSFISTFFSRMQSFIYELFIARTFLLLMFAVVILCILLDNKRSNIIKIITIITISLMLFITFPCGNYFPARMFILHYIIFSIVILQYLFSLDRFCLFIIKKININRLVMINLILLSIVLVLYIKLFHFNQIRYKQLSDYHKNAIIDITVNKFNDWYSHFVYFDDVTDDISDWKNIAFANYYHFKSVKISNNNILESQGKK